MIKKIFLSLFLAVFFILFGFEKADGAVKIAVSSASLKSEYQDRNNDNRTKILKEYLEKHSSPLASYSDIFVKTADRYNLDWRLVASISGVESTFGKFIPSNSYNGWGWGIYGDNVMRFSSWEEGIETISKGLRENYLDKWGAETIYEIGSIYAASPRWAGNVIFFMDDINRFAYQNSIENLSISI